MLRTGIAENCMLSNAMEGTIVRYTIRMVHEANLQVPRWVCNTFLSCAKHNLPFPKTELHCHDDHTISLHVTLADILEQCCCTWGFSIGNSSV